MKIDNFLKNGSNELLRKLGYTDVEESEGFIDPEKILMQIGVAVEAHVKIGSRSKIDEPTIIREGQPKVIYNRLCPATIKNRVLAGAIYDLLHDDNAKITREIFIDNLLMPDFLIKHYHNKIDYLAKRDSVVISDKDRIDIISNLLDVFRTDLITQMKKLGYLDNDYLYPYFEEKKANIRDAEKQSHSIIQKIKDGFSTLLDR